MPSLPRPNTVIGSPITVGVNPVQLSVSGDGNTLYVANYSGATTADGTVSVIDTATLPVIDAFAIEPWPGSGTEALRSKLNQGAARSSVHAVAQMLWPRRSTGGQLMTGAVNGPADPVLDAAIFRRLSRRLAASGQITLPAGPGMVDAYVAMCAHVFGALGNSFVADQFTALREALGSQLAEAFAASPRSSIDVSFDSPAGTLLNYHVTPRWETIEAAYGGWTVGGDAAPFGTQPDARVCAVAAQLAAELGDPAATPVLDVGAGTGRNSLAMARCGHPVDAVELTPTFADKIRADAQRESLNIRVITGDALAGIDGLRPDYQLMVLSGVVSDFRTTEQLRAVFELAARCLAPGGRLVANTFIPRGGYVPSAQAREFSQQLYSSIFTREELAAAVAGLPLELVSDDSVHDYEKSHLPEGVWPPTQWYAD